MRYAQFKRRKRLACKKYLVILEDDMLYSPASIANLAELRGFIAGDTSVRKCLRHTLSRLSIQRGFPPKGDGTVQVFPKSGLFKAWYGWRWKMAAGMTLLDVWE